MQTLHLLMMLMTLSSAEPDQTYWAYVPDPPILHPVIWEGPEIPVYVNDTQTLGLPSDGHMKQHLERNFTYNGIGLGLPVCVAKNVSTPGCLRSSPVTMHINDSLVGWTVRLNMLGDWSGGRKINLPIPPSRPSCNKRLKLNIETVPWRDCPGNGPVRYDIPGTGRYVIDWSRSNRSGWARELISGLWNSDTQYQQNLLWRLMGAMGEVVQVTEYCKSGTPCNHASVLKDGTRDWTTVAKTVNVSACVPSPYALLIGNIQSMKVKSYLECHPKYHWICVQSMKKAKPLKFDAAQAASEFVNALRNVLPSMPHTSVSVWFCAYYQQNVRLTG